MDQDVEVVNSLGLTSARKDDCSVAIHDNDALVYSDPKHEHPEADASTQDKMLKKPDKILPCPRCDSLNTKFCYYNNYNANQPRHFCRNCQRYWTAGGTMRNVPVGAGKRKSKQSVQQQSHSADVSGLLKSLTGNDVVMNFGQETSLFKPVASVLNLGDQEKNAEMTFVSCGENTKESSLSSSLTPKSAENDFTKFEASKEQMGTPGFFSGLHLTNPLQSFPGPPWPYGWGPGWNSIAAMAASHCHSDNGIPGPTPWVPPVILAAPAFCPPTFHFPIMPASFWACASGWPIEAWNIPCRGSTNDLSPSPSAISKASSGDPPTLGKHSRDGILKGEEKIKKKSLWIPKTLRISDPEEAAKSSIWSTLGIRPDESVKRGGLFRGFQSNSESTSNASGAAKILHANPAALSRSQTFQEST